MAHAPENENGPARYRPARSGATTVESSVMRGLDPRIWRQIAGSSPAMTRKGQTTFSSFAMLLRVALE
jgi:hypothetical protein